MLRPHSPRASKLVALALCLALLPVLASTTLAEEVAGPGEKATWVTMGADAFEVLSRNPAVLGEALPLQANASRGDIVLTRLPDRAIDSAAAFLHERFHRCGSFVAHASEAEALRVFERVTTAKASPLLASFDIGQQALVGQMLPQMQASEILGTISHLSTAYNNRYYLNASGEQSALWIRDLWAQYAAGRPDVTVETYAHSFLQPSVILTIPGATLPDEYVVLGGHLDSIQSGATNTDPATLAPGADDDASGIAALSEAIRVLLANGFTPDRTVQFMGYAGEETGLRGSGDIASAYAAASTNVVAVLQLDMTGYNGSVEDVALIDDNTNTELTNFVGTLIDTYQPELAWTTTTCGYPCSDHASWFNEGYATAFPFEARFGQYNPTIHTPSDTVATLSNSADHALKFSKIALSFAVETATSACSVNADCDDGLYCNGAETCSSGACQAGVLPCGGGACDEAGDVCTSVCGDGTCDVGETCTTCPADCPSFPLSGSACGNGLCEAGDGEDCVSCPSDCAGVQGGNPSNRFCCGFGGDNPVGCADSACTSGGSSCTETPQGSSSSTCCGDLVCEGPEDGFNCALDCGPPASCGDGSCDGGEDSCSCAFDCGAAPGTEAGSCSDGVDNDCDLDIDCADADCAGDAACQAVDCSTFGDKTSCNTEPTCSWSNKTRTCLPA